MRKTCDIVDVGCVAEEIFFSPFSNRLMKQERRKEKERREEDRTKEREGDE